VFAARLSTPPVTSTSNRHFTYYCANGEAVVWGAWLVPQPPNMTHDSLVRDPRFPACLGALAHWTDPPSVRRKGSNLALSHRSRPPASGIDPSAPPSLTRSSSSLSRVQRRLRVFTSLTTKTISETPPLEDTHGAYGLNLLSEPSEPRLDFVFVSPLTPSRYVVLLAPSIT
jgi:hypothetical protein